MENVIVIDYSFALSGLIRPAFGILYGPIWILVLLFTVIGLVFICKAFGCMGIRFKKSGSDKGKFTKEARQPSEIVDFFGVVTGTGPKGSAAPTMEVTSDDDQDVSEGKPVPDAEAVTPEEDAAFVFRYDQELEDYLSSPEENAEEVMPGNGISLEFLPVVTEEDPIHAELDDPSQDLIMPEEEKAATELQNQEDWIGLLHQIMPSGSSDDGDAGDVASTTDLDLPDFCIFEELFRNCDSESKLILLDELYAVGDQKELRFLQKLSVDPDPKVRNKAAQIREALEKALSAEAEVEDDISPLHALDVRHWPVGSPEADLEEPVQHAGDAESPESNRLPDETLQPLEACFLGDPSEMSAEADTMDIGFEPDSQTMWEDGEARTRIKVRENKIETGQQGRKFARSLLELARSFLIH